MDFQKWFSVTSGVLVVIGLLIYAWSIYKRKTKPAKSSWVVWAILDTIVFAGMYAKESLNGQIIGAVIGIWIVVVLALRYGNPGWTLADKFCLAGATLGITLWAVTGDPIIAIIITLAMLFLGAVPTFISSYKEPGQEDQTAWIVFFFSCVAALPAIPKMTIEDAGQPITFFVIELIIMWLVVIRPIFLRKKLAQ